MLFTLTFAYVSPETQDYAPLVDQFGTDIKVVVEANTKTEAINDPWVENFCRGQGNDARVREVF
jgi:hypothetical protein